MARKIKTANEMFDVLSSMGGGQYATVCHLDYARINLPDEKTGGFLGFFQHTQKGTFKGFGKRFKLKNLSGIITITRYRQLNVIPVRNVNYNYRHVYRPQADRIRQSFGIPQAKARKPVYRNIRYGKGIRVGNTPNTQGKAYWQQNTFSANKDVKYFGVDDKGHIIKEFSLNELKNYLYNLRNIEGLNALKRITQDNRVIDRYIKQILDLKMEYTTFLNDRIIYMLGTANNEKFYFTNDHLTSMIEGILVNPQEIIQKAKELFNTDAQMMTEQIRKQNIIENRINRIICESLNGIIEPQEKYYFNSEEWDYPEIINERGKVVKQLSIGERMRSIVEINGKLYYSDKGNSHYGAITNALLKIHHLKNEEQLERKFKCSIDDICEDVRQRVTWESRFYYGVNLLMTDSKDTKHIEQVAEDLKIPLEKIKVLYYYSNDWNDKPQIINYK